MKRALLVLALLSFAGPALALMIEVPLDRLAATSDAVVRAKVTDLQSRWTDDHATIVTDVTFSIVESWSGDLVAGSQLVLVQPDDLARQHGLCHDVDIDDLVVHDVEPDALVAQP